MWAYRCTFSSARENPRPALTRRLYLIEGHRTTGRSLSTGRGATAATLARRALRRRCFRPGWRVCHISFPSLEILISSSRDLIRLWGCCTPDRNGF